MIIVFQILAVVLVAIAAFLIFRSGGARQQAVRRIFLLLFIAGVALSVFFPQVLTWVANLLGIGRGTDLIVYLVTIAFIGFVATTYRRFRHMEKDQTALARQLALLTAQAPDESGDIARPAVDDPGTP
jgi:small membrane protein